MVNRDDADFAGACNNRILSKQKEIQWGSENRAFKNWKHLKNGHFYVRFLNGKKMADLA